MLSWTEIMSSLENLQAINRFENMMFFHVPGTFMPEFRRKMMLSYSLL